MVSKIVAILLAVVPLWLGYQLQTRMNTDESSAWIRHLGSAALYFCGFTFVCADIMVFIIYSITAKIPQPNDVVASLLSALCVALTILAVYKVEVWREGTGKLSVLGLIFGIGGATMLLTQLF